MRKLLLTLTMLFATNAYAAGPEIGKLAPDFLTTTISGKKVKLSDYRGQIVVLEWNNPGCPFVRKFYSVGEMQKLQAEATAKGVIWLTINSSAAGNEGNLDATAAKAYIDEMQAKQSEYILDSKGEIGHSYHAKSTPHMFVIDKDGNLAYAGAIDDKPTPKSEDIIGAKNYVTAAIDALNSNKSVEVSSTQAYGCNVKY